MLFAKAIWACLERPDADTQSTVTLLSHRHKGLCLRPELEGNKHLSHVDTRHTLRAFHSLDIRALVTNHFLGHLEASWSQLCGSHLLPTVAFPFARSLPGYRLVSNYLRTYETAFSFPVWSISQTSHRAEASVYLNDSDLSLKL